MTPRVFRIRPRVRAAWAFVLTVGLAVLAGAPARAFEPPDDWVDGYIML